MFFIYRRHYRDEVGFGKYVLSGAAPAILMPMTEMGGERRALRHFAVAAPLHFDLSAPAWDAGDRISARRIDDARAASLFRSADIAHSAAKINERNFAPPAEEYAGMPGIEAWLHAGWRISQCHAIR